MILARKSWLLVVLTIASGVTTVHATDRLVPSQFATIQAAIDAAAPGDSVIIADGTYTGAGTPPIVDMGAAEAADCAGLPPEAPLPAECDCNANDILDLADVTGGTSVDCNANNVPDECEPGGCNGNGFPDECDIAAGTSSDCNTNGLPDECEPECNNNGVPDECDIAAGTSSDCDSNGVPDECGTDCNTNGVVDTCDIAMGTSEDCNFNGVADECDETVVSTAVGFDGDGDFINVGQSLPDLNGTLTFEAWVRPDDITEAQLIVARREDSMDGYMFFIENGGLHLRWTSFFNYSTSPVLMAGVWSHVAVIQDSDPGVASFFLDGDLISQSPLEVIAGGFSPVADSIGGLAPGAGADLSFGGAIDEVAVWTNTRTPMQIAADMSTILTGNESGLVAYWRFEEGQGNVATDIAGGHNGTLMGDAAWTARTAPGADCPTKPDCNSNGVDDDLDLAAGTGADCNTNGIPDECDTGMLADYDVDGDVDENDYAGFEACLFGPAMDMQSVSPCGASCLQWFDANGDNRIDLFDFGFVQENITSP